MVMKGGCERIHILSAKQQRDSTDNREIPVRRAAPNAFNTIYQSKRKKEQMHFKRLVSGTLAAVAILFAVAAAPAQAQTGVIEGQVLDGASQRPLGNAQVLVAGTGVGQLTNSAGRFLLLNVPAGEHTVQVTLIGYAEAEQTVTVSAGQTSSVDIEMSSTAIALNEIVVTGVGAETERRALGTSVEVLSAEDFELAPVQSIDQVLQGRVAGATVSATSANPGTGSLINFRGVSSVFGAQTPVIYVDGVRVDNDQSTAAGTGGEQSSALADLLTSDIERIEVTKGGAASTLFGSDAATGVIQIFTKKGTPGAPRITARVERGIETPELKYIFDMGLIFPERVESGEITERFMRDLYFKNGDVQNYYVGVSGGTADVTYSVSGRLEDRTGTQPRDASTNYNIRGGLQASLTDNFTLEFSGSYVRHNFERLYNGASIEDPLTTFEVGDALFFSGASTLHEALDIFLMPEIDEWVNRFIFSAGARWNIRDDLTTKITLGTDNRNNQQRQFDPIGFTPGEPTGQLFRWDRSFTSVSLDAGATYAWQNEGGSLGSSLTVGVQGFREDESVIWGRGRTFALPGTFDFGSAAVITADEGNSEVFNGGVYVDEQLSLWDKLYVGGGFRVDAGSSFGDNIDTEFYPKATGSYILSEDVGLPLVDELKVRGAYGQTGKFPGAFLKDRTFSATSFRGESAPRFANPGNEDLRPEKTSTIEAGIDAALWNNRIGLDFTAYEARTTDALFSVPRQPVTGQGTQQENVGEILNRGVEVAVNLQLLNTQALAWSIGGTFNYNHNEVTDMGGVSEFSAEGGQKRVTGCWDPSGEIDESTCRGGPVGAWYLTMPIDTNGDGLTDGSQRRFTGTFPVPDKSGGVNTTISIGNDLTISALADWAGGHDVFDYGSVWATFNGIYRRELVRCGTEEGAGDGCAYAFPTQYRADGTVRGKYSQSAARSGFLYDGDFFKLREVSLRYVLPESVAGGVNASRATLYLNGRNLWIWSRNQMIDGELNGLSGGGLRLGSESSITLSPNRTFRLGVEVVF
ncbi:MAG: TonB-dependent receptor [Gemmatimonadetes bacterium]|nr:TonB-dependent receptor [Gemmatimonadota bacterium]MXX73186.1 TonB-dependent receptor [Gemmatimonadota bacterium]MYC90859.1 TonB-dependent receptor [Gemmatimonadota bacterium]MYG34316.1 TonB-dependent receptor [Gemmatimonadota bacterium]MYJ16881.1 TonB-dependent receptor [Gemmatimonadota bacterium]